MEPKWLTERQLMAYLNVSRNTARKIAAEAGAVYYIGRLVRYDREAIDAALKKEKVTRSRG